MKIILLGDWHAFHLYPWPWQCLGKRLAGQINLWLNRRHRFLQNRAAGLLEKIRSLGPDLVLLSGDLTTTALDREFKGIRAAIDRLSCSLGVRAVPGNHDRYTFFSQRTRKFERFLTPGDLSPWPRKWELPEDLTVIGLDSARARLTDSTGEIGEQQLQILEKELSGVAADRRVVVLCHYPFSVPAGVRHPPGHRLRDAEKLQEKLANFNRPLLFVHGHVHEPWCWHPPGARNILAVNAGSPLYRQEPDFPLGQGFWHIDTAADSTDNGLNGWKLFHHHERADGDWQCRPCVLPGQAGEPFRPKRTQGV